MRTDLPLAAQIVQTGHACLEAGNKFPQPAAAPSFLIVFAVKSKAALIDAMVRVNALGIQTVVFDEPDYDYGYTAACTEPVQGEQRQILKKYRLWQ